MEGIDLDYFKHDNIIRQVNTSTEFYSYPSEDNNKDAPATYTYMMDI